MGALRIAHYALLWPALFSSLACSLHAQPYWAPVGFNDYHLVGPVQQIYASDDGNEIYYAGWFKLDTGEYWYDRNPVMRYSQGQWDTLGYFYSGFVRSVVIYHDTLIAGGYFFQTIDGEPLGNVAYWANGGWHAYGAIEGAVRKLRVLNDTLYAVGGFHIADGDSCMGVSRREGSAWVPVGGVQDPEVAMFEIIKYDGHLYACGNGTLNGAKGFFRYDGGQWLGVLPGITGGISHIESMAVYQGDLYVGGQILLQEGNAGQAIMRWDGSAFHPVGNGLQLFYNNFTALSNASCMTVHDDLLWVGGGFNYASGVGAHGVATWDGSRWCGVPGDMGTLIDGDLYPDIYGLAFYQDTLFVACGDSADGQFVNKGANYIASSYVDTCGAPVVVFEEMTDGGELHVWQSAAGELSIEGIPHGTALLTLFDATGRYLLQLSVSVIDAGPTKVRIPALPAGGYVLKCGWLARSFLLGVQ